MAKRDRTKRKLVRMYDDSEMSSKKRTKYDRISFSKTKIRKQRQK
jgi:hypothetical protein